MNHKYVKYLIFFSMPIGMMVSILLSMSSAYLELIMIPVTLIGVVAFVGSMTAAAASKGAHSLEGWLGERKSIVLIQAVALAGVFLMASMAPYIGALFFLLIHFLWGFFGVVSNHYVNQHIETSHRATMLSIKNMFINLSIFLLFPLVGYVSRDFSMQIAFLGLGGLILVYTIWMLWYGHRLRQIH